MVLSKYEFLVIQIILENLNSIKPDREMQSIHTPGSNIIESYTMSRAQYHDTLQVSLTNSEKETFIGAAPSKLRIPSSKKGEYLCRGVEGCYMESMASTEVMRVVLE